MAQEKKVTTKTLTLEGERPQLMIQESEYKGRPVLNIVFTGAGFPTVLKFGPGKAKMMLWATDEIQAFLAKHSGKLDSGD
jgi:hypothetical protein